MSQYSEFYELSWEDFQKQFKQRPLLRSALSYLSRENLADLFSHIEILDFKVAEVYMNPKTYSAVRKWSRDVLEPVTDAKLLRKGILAFIWGAMIIINSKIPEGIVMAVSDNEFKTAAILRLNEEVFTGGEYLAQCEKRIDEISSELQSMLRKASQTIRNMLIKVEENHQ